jgi:FkbH-like protein
MHTLSSSAVRAGGLSLADIVAALRDLDLTGCSVLPIAVLRNVVVEPIEPYLRYLAFEIGCDARVRFGEYDHIQQESLGGRPGLLDASTAFVLVFNSLDVLSPVLTTDFAAAGPDEIAAEGDRIVAAAEAAIDGIRRQTAATILWHAFELPLFPALGIADARQPLSQTSVIAALNERLRLALSKTGSGYLVDTNACRARLGAAAFYDARYWHIGRAPYSREGLWEIALEQFKYVRASRGRQKKCLVLDCDDVLWGGVVGEEGLSGIRIGRSYPGSAYLEFQQEVLNLHRRGVILAICSKNNDADVRAVFRGHPDMLLKEEHFACVRINWTDKPTNLREIAAELNIGLDSLLFADDSEVECDLVRRLLPEVEVLHLPRDRAVENRSRLAAGGWFDTLAVSEDDRARGARYLDEAARNRMRSESANLEAYFQALGMMASIRTADPLSISRIAQLTRKTNQFNLTTRRYSDEDIARMAAREDCDVLSLRLSDRYGDSGLVGVAILVYDGPAVTLDTLLLSCRVLGRGVEDAFLVTALKRARARGALTAIGEYRPTARNQMVGEFYTSRGFNPRDGGAGTNRFTLDLGAWAGTEPWFFKAVVAVLG